MKKKIHKTKYKRESNLEKDSVIIHLAGEAWQRPWKVSNGAFGQLWDKYYELSPYKDTVLQRGIYHPKVKIYSTDTKTSYKLFGILPILSIEDK